ncbi:MAG TPA: hypothetical protein VF613_11410 [Longimicrobium sp.]
MTSPAAAADGLRDPWVRPGLALLAVLTVAAVLLYRGAPQSAAEVGGRTWVALAPDAFTPRVSRARERVQAALRAAAAGDTAGAIARFAEAEQEAWTARANAGDSTQTATATELWASATLDRAELMLRAGAAPWYRGDNTQLLQEARAAVQRVEGVPTAPATRTRATALAARIERQLRPGPLEWIPR